jgi:tetratricopeptide (TPR) repeat protein
MKCSILLFAIVLTLSRSVSAQSTDQLSRLRLAQALEQSGAFDKAETLFEGLHSEDPVNYVYFDGLRRCYTELKEYGAAIQLSVQRLHLQPEDIGLMASIGELYYRAGEEPQADSTWNAIIALSPKNQIGYRVVASAELSQRLFEKAIATYVRARKTIGDPALFSDELSSLYSLVMDYRDATREFISMLVGNENQLEFIESRMGLYTSKEDGLKAAIEVTESAASSSDSNIPVLRLLLWLYLEGQQFDKAFNVALKIDDRVGSKGNELFSFAERAFSAKAYYAAAEAYRTAAEAYKSSPMEKEAEFGYARAIEELSDLSDSTSVDRKMFTLQIVPSYNKAISLYLSLAYDYPKSEIAPRALYRVGLIRYQKFFDLDGAVSVFDSVLTLVPSGPMVPTIKELMGDIFTAKGDMNEASHYYTAVATASEALPDLRAEGRFRLAELQYFSGNFDSSLTILQQISQNFGSDEANDALRLEYFITANKVGFSEPLKEFAHAEFLSRQKKLSEAIAAMNDLITNFSTSPLAGNALMKKGDWSVTIGKFDDALDAYNKLITDFPKNILCDEAQFNIAEVYQYHVKDTTKAIHAYEQVLASYPQSLLADKARKRIRMLRGDTI